MGKVRPAIKANLIIGMLSNVPGLFEVAETRLEKKFGPVELKSLILPFTFTNYYEEEMGKDLKRQFLSFQKLIDPGELADIKLFTNKLEERFQKVARPLPSVARPLPSVAGPLPTVAGPLPSVAERQRPINLDPGYLTGSKLVLASTKDYYHRVYLKKGIYAEVTLRYIKGAFEPFPWTYPDYRSKEYIDFFTEIRTLYMKKLKDQ